MRIYVTGRLAVESDGRAIHETDLPSRQARRLLACLVCERARPVSRDELLEVLWAEAPPAAWESALNALASKLRKLSASWKLTSEYGAYQLRLPADAWVDWEAAARALDEAEGAIRSGRHREGWGPANVAVAVTKRGFLAGERGRWVEERRRRLEELRARALEAYAQIAIEASQVELAVHACEEAVSYEPFRESAYQHLMRAHAASGNRAEAVRAYHRCRELLADELGVSPSAETESTYLRILRD